MAQVLASANHKAKELGVDVQTSLITARAESGERRLAVTRLLRHENYIYRRGGDSMIDIDPANAVIKQILRGGQ